MKFKLFLTVFFLTHVTFGQQAKRVQVPGTSCSLIPPKDFVLDKDISGFVNSEAAASITVAEMQVPLDTIISELSEKNFPEHDGRLIHKTAVSGKGTNATLITAEQMMNGKKYRTLILVFGDDKTAVVVAGNYPDASASMEPVIKAAVLSAIRDKPRAN